MFGKMLAAKFILVSAFSDKVLASNPVNRKRYSVEEL